MLVLLQQTEALRVVAVAHRAIAEDRHHRAVAPIAVVAVATREAHLEALIVEARRIAVAHVREAAHIRAVAEETREVDRSLMI